MKDVHHLPIAFVSAVTGAILVLGGCKGGKKPTSPPTFEVELSLYVLRDENGELRPVTNAMEICTELERRADVCGFLAKAEPRRHPDGSLDHGRVTVLLYAASEEEANAQARMLESPILVVLRPVHPSSGSLGPRVAAGEDIVPGYSAYAFEPRVQDWQDPIPPEHLLLGRAIDLTSAYIESASPDKAQSGVINVSMTQRGGELMRKLTEKMEKGRDRIAILLDDEVVAAPTVQATLSTSFLIEGINDPKEQLDLCRALLSPISALVQILEVRSLSAP